MIFLIEYDRDQGRMVTIESFNNSDRETAEESRFARELDLNRKGIDHEVVLLEAASEDALRQTHLRYFEDMPDLIEIAKSKALATGFFQGAQVVQHYMKDRYVLISEAEGKPEETGYKVGCMKRLWIRAYLWMETLAKLNDPLDFQAISIGNRALLEILVDLILLHPDKSHELAAKMFWWGESEKLKASEQIISFYADQGLTVPEEYEAQEVFYKTRKSIIESMRRAHWPQRKNATKHPDRWTGNSNLFQDIERADQLYGSVVKAEIGSTLVEYYRTQYRKMNWRIHSGVNSVLDPPAESFYLVCGFAFKWCADFAMLSTKITMTDFGLEASVADLELEWENIKRKRDSVYINELYKFHSSPSYLSQA
jgi:hypothetical protein